MEPRDAIDVSVNGERLQVPAGTTLTGLLDRLALDATRLAVEHNLNVVPRAEYSGRILQAGDRVEVVTFVGGG